MATAAKRAKLIAKANAISKGVEVQLAPETYRRDLLQALNYYNSNHDDKDKKKWFISHFAKIDKKLAVQFLKIDEYHFRHAGILARLMDGGSELEQKELDYLQDVENVPFGYIDNGLDDIVEEDEMKENLRNIFDKN